jgi:hypothetical protein
MLVHVRSACLRGLDTLMVNTDGRPFGVSERDRFDVLGVSTCPDRCTLRVAWRLPRQR